MARGNIVLDENLKDLKPGLQDKNLRVFEAPAGFSDDRVAELTSGRILITNNSKDFLQLAIEHEFGIIATEGAPRNAKDLVANISAAITSHSLWSLKNPFVFYLSDKTLRILEDG